MRIWRPSASPPIRIDAHRSFVMMMKPNELLTKGDTERLKQCVEYFSGQNGDCLLRVQAGTPTLGAAITEKAADLIKLE